MPFLLYETSSSGEHRRYKRLREISLAGKNGPLSRIALRGANRQEIPHKWHASSSGIIIEVLGDPKCQEILIDLKPNDKERVSLYKLSDVWGYSEDNWTPVAFLLESLYVDHKVDRPPDTFKLEFDDDHAVRGPIAEFLYLRGGVCEGSWNWGMVGFVNGALLWPKAFNYLTGQLRERIPM